MLGRCYNPKAARYKDWGGRGIRVCDEWKDNFINFKTWALNNGYEDTLSIDRIDNNKNYGPDNCRWATLQEQNSNKRNTPRISIDNEVLALKTVCEDLGLSYNSIKSSISKGRDITNRIQTAYYEKYNKKVMVASVAKE